MPKIPSDPLHRCHHQYTRAPPALPNKIPVNKPHPPPMLKTRLPYYLLPEKLIIHDEGNHLSTTGTNAGIREYGLDLTPQTWSDIRAQRETAQNAWTKTISHHKYFRFFLPLQHTTGEDGSMSDSGAGTLFTAVFVPCPRLPERIFHVPTADLYLHSDRAHRKGEGHHSFVYSVEWDLPRAVLDDPWDQVCMKCIHEAVDEIIRTGPGLMDVALACSIRVPHSEHRGNGNANGDSVYSAEPERNFEPEVASYKGPWFTVKLPSDVWDKVFFTDTSAPCHHRTLASGKTPGHIFPNATTRVRLCAKVSKPDDDHLKAEARNYQRFPDAFFGVPHASTSHRPKNVDLLLEDQAPIEALIPQFYGHYKSLEDDDDKCLNMILLEDCGKAVQVNELTCAELMECVQLFKRLHAARWIHQSAYTRNIVVSEVKNDKAMVESESEESKESSCEKSFRLIDFGRTRKFGEESVGYSCSSSDEMYYAQRELGLRY